LLSCVDLAQRSILAWQGQWGDPVVRPHWSRSFTA
jgi:hypothetical protein